MSLRILTLTTVLICLIASDVVPAIARQQSSTPDSSISNVQVYGDHFYWLDGKDKGIYRARVPKAGSRGSQPRATLGEPEKLWTGLPLASPVGITVDPSGVVYVLDGQLKAVFSLASAAPKLLYSSSSLMKPSAIAAAGNKLFLVDALTSKLYSVDPISNQLMLEYEFKGETPDRLLGDGNNLIAYRSRSKVLLHFWLANVETPKEQEGERPSVRQLVSGKQLTLTKVLGTVTDLSLKDGIVYFIDSKAGKLTLLPLQDAVPSSIPLGLAADNPFAIVTSADSLFFFEGDPIHIRRQPSLQPVTLNFVGEWTSKSIVEFYDDLRKKQLLPARTVSLASATTLKDLIVELNVLPTGYVDEFQILFCKLNRSICTPEQEKLPSAGATVSEGFAVKLNPGQSVTIPDLPVTPYITRRNLKLPLDPQSYNPEVFGHLYKSSLEQVARELAPKNMSAESLRETLKSYNRDYVGEDILGEVKGFFSIPIQGARVTGVVPRSDLLDPTSLVRRLAEKKNISGTSPMFQMKQQGLSSQPVVALPSPRPNPSPADCLPNDPGIRSAAMDLINYCEPQFSDPPKIGIIDYKFNPRHPAFLLPNGDSALKVFNQPVEIDPLDVDSARTTYKEELDHGTHIAAIIGARPQAGAMVGLLPTSILYGVPINFLAEAVGEWHFLRVFNVSLGEGGATGGPLSGVDDLDDLFSTHRHELFVLAAGNDNRKISKQALAAHGVWDNVIVVGATDVPAMNANNQRPPRAVLTLPNGKGSNRHPFYVGLMAPGEKIKGALLNGQYGVADGTSEAAAFVSSGAAALMTLEPEWAAWQVKFRLVATADLWTGTPLSDAVLAGEFNFKRALADRDKLVIQRELDPVPCRGRIDDVSLSQRMLIKQGVDDPKRPKWNEVLRITRDPTETEYTIIFYSENTEPERVNRQLLRLVKVTTKQIRENGSFIFIPDDPSTCTGGVVSLFELLDFVNKGPFPPSSN